MLKMPEGRSYSQSFQSKLLEKMDKEIADKANAANKKCTNERYENCQNEQKFLDVTHSAANIRDQVSVVWELKPVEPPVQKYGHGGRDPIPRMNMRVLVVVDVSHSMGEPYVHDEKVSKLDKVKMFSKMIIKILGPDDLFGIVTFGTKAKVVFPPKRMAPEWKEKANECLDKIKAGGVTHLSDGLFTGVDQFVMDMTMLTQKQHFDDTLMLFTDGMANEGMTDTASILEELHTRIETLRTENEYGPDWGIKFVTIGTSGFLPQTIYEVGQAFSSDAYFYLDDTANLELNLFRPIFLRQTAVVNTVKVCVTALSGVKFDVDKMHKEYQRYSTNGPLTVYSDTRVEYFIHDISSELPRHILNFLILPKNHKKVLKKKDVLKIDVSYNDTRLVSQTLDRVIPYHEIPRKIKYNIEKDIVLNAQEMNRVAAVKALSRSATYVGKLDRARSADTLEVCLSEIEDFTAFISEMLTSEESHQMVTEYNEPIVLNLQNMAKKVKDFGVTYDNAWAQLKALESSLSRETPTASSVYEVGAEMYNTKKVQEKMYDMCIKLKDMYRMLGLNTNTIDTYQDVINELREKWELENYNPEPEPIKVFHFTIT